MHGKVEVFSFWVIHVELLLDRISRFVRQAVKKSSVGPGETQKRSDPELCFSDEPRRTTFSDAQTAAVTAIAILTATVQAPDRFNFLFSTCNYRPQTKFTMVMFSQVSVCPQGGVYPIACWDTHPNGQTPPLADTPLGRHPQADTPPCPVHAGIHLLPSACWHTPPCPVHAGIHPLHSACWDMVNKWAVCIPLKYILVSEIGLIFM